MSYRKGLIQQNLKTLKRTKWYHQRFDGCPQFLGMAAFPHFFKEKRKPKGTDFTDGLVIYSEGTADWHINMKDIKRIADIFIQKSKKETKISRKLIAKWQKDEKIFYKKCKEVENTDIGSLSSNQLLKLYKDFRYIYQKWFSMTSIIDGFALGTDEFINQQLNGLLKKKGIERGRGKIFSTLTAPTDTSFVGEAEISLLKVAREIEKVPALKTFFRKNSPSQIQRELKKYPEVYLLLEQHQKNYFWLKNNYIDNYVLTVKDFILDLKKIFQGTTEIKKRLRETLNQPEANKKKKKQMTKKLNLPRFLRILLEISEDFTTWQDQRKKSTLFTTHYVSLLLEEISRRTKYSLYELKFFIAAEIIALLENKGYYPSKKEAKARINYSVFYNRLEGYECYLGKQGKSLVEEILKRDEKTDVDDFRGMTACPGRIKGMVKILRSAREVNKIKKGNILVAVMTRPDYIVGIKRAAAIVTNEGGITCHAAIVSRELNIPCVIGTKIATEVLKDGDLVEVNANHGVITVLKRT